MCYHAPNPEVSRASGPTLAVPKLKKRHHSAMIISQNVRGLKSDEKLDVLFSVMENRNVFAACLQETWRSGSEILQHDRYRLITAGLNPQEVKCRRGSQGVAIALSPLAVKYWEAGGSEKHTDLGARVIGVRLLMSDKRNKEVGIFLVSAYAPVGVESQELWDDFFATLDRCIARKRNKDLLFIGVDTNSSMGTSVDSSSKSIGRFGVKHVNDAGQRFKSYLATSSLCALTTRFQKKSYVSWVHPRSKKGHQIDHVISCCNEAHRFVDSGVISQLVDSDHRAVYGRIYIARNLAKKASQRKRLTCLNYEKLSSEESRRELNEVIVSKYMDGNENTPKYTRLVNAATAATRQNLSPKKKAQPHWFQEASQQLLPLIQARNQAMAAACGRRSRKVTNQLRQARHQVKRAVAKAKNQWLIDQCELVNHSSRRGTKDCWDTISRIKKGMTKTKPCAERNMKKPDGSIASSPQENAEVFKDHFKKLFSRSPSHENSVTDDLPQLPVFEGLDHAPTDEEIVSATKKLKNKAPGSSGLCSQVWKSMLDSPDAFSILKAAILDFWEKENSPEEWDIGLLTILPKKGDLSNPGNYRGIVLLETLYKIAAIILHDRLQPVIESIDHEEQCGFRSLRGCPDGIFTVKMAIKKRREHGLETWIMFLDLVKAFDRVPREPLWKVLRKFGVPDKVVRLIEALHEKVTFEFTVSGVTHSLNCSIGVKQGDILGPALFTLYIAAIMTTWRSSNKRPLCIFRTKMDDKLTGRRFTARGEEFAVPDSEYADDTAVLFPTRHDLEDGVPKIMSHFAKWGMEVHSGSRATSPVKESKTEILFVAKPSSLYADPQTFDGADLSDISLCDGCFIPIVDCFCYLGSWIARDGKDDLDVEKRIEKAGAAFGALRKGVFSCQRVSPHAKKLVYTVLVLTVLLYGSELWCLTEKLLNKLRSFHARCIRAMCRVTLLHTRAHRISTATLMKRLGLASIDDLITTKILRWAGHVMRMKKHRLPRKLISSWVRNPRPRGCPQFTYGRGLYKALHRKNISKETWSALAFERDIWRKMIMC